MKLSNINLFGFETHLLVIVVGAVILMVFLEYQSRKKKQPAGKLGEVDELLTSLSTSSQNKNPVPWRVDSSRRWLKNFRLNKSKFSQRQRFSYIRKVDHFLWEEILMSCFEERGYPIIRTKMTRDAGSDGFVMLNGQQIIIQAKRYSGSVSKAHVLTFSTVITNNRLIAKGLFIHTGRTSRPIHRIFHKNKNIHLLSGVDDILNFLDGQPVKMFNIKLNKIQREAS